jgi:hypothetical protein
VQDDVPDAAEDGLAAIVRAPLDLHHWLPRRGQPLGIPPCTSWSGPTHGSLFNPGRTG